MVWDAFASDSLLTIKTNFLQMDINASNTGRKTGAFIFPDWTLTNLGLNQDWKRFHHDGSLCDADNRGHICRREDGLKQRDGAMEMTECADQANDLSRLRDGHRLFLKHAHGTQAWHTFALMTRRRKQTDSKSISVSISRTFFHVMSTWFDQRPVEKHYVPSLNHAIDLWIPSRAQ